MKILLESFNSRENSNNNSSNKEQEVYIIDIQEILLVNLIMNVHNIDILHSPK